MTLHCKRRKNTGGLFSNASVKLGIIVDYINTNTNKTIHNGILKLELNNVKYNRLFNCDPYKNKVKTLTLTILTMDNSVKKYNFSENSAIYVTNIKNIISAYYGYESKTICVKSKITSLLSGDYEETYMFPKDVDSSTLWIWYKTNLNTDITFHYFEHYNNVNETLINKQINYKESHQYLNYKDLSYSKICPVVRKYFSPSKEIKTIISTITEKYKVNYDNTCVLFYRGNDKNRETEICSYEEYTRYSEEVLQKNPNVQFLIQSDETQFIEYMRERYPNNSFYFKDEIRHIKKCNSTVDRLMKKTNYEFSKRFLAITIIMSKCNTIVCGTGNCSIWIMLYRESAKNLYQNNKGRWILS